MMLREHQRLVLSLLLFMAVMEELTCEAVEVLLWELLYEGDLVAGTMAVGFNEKLLKWKKCGDVERTEKWLCVV